jgi:hypothetical protein
VEPVFIHRPRHQLSRDLMAEQGFYGMLARAFAARGHRVVQQQRRSIEDGPSYRVPGLHFVHQGLVRRAGVLNTGVAYLMPFWYADPRGLFSESSVAALAFDPDAVPDKAARGFHRRLRDRYVATRNSRYDQPRPVQRFDPGAIAVFLQGPSQPMERAALMSEPEMVARLLEGAGGRQILVKPHPRNPDRAALTAIRKLTGRRDNLRIVEANLHDMLAQAAVCCSVSSSVGLEAMLHRVPVLQFGRTDFHHAVVTVGPADDIVAALRRAEATDWPFERFLYWFLQGQMLNIARDDWFDRLRARLA